MKLSRLLPDRLQWKIDQIRIDHAVRGILQTRPHAAVEASQALFVAHVLLRSSDLLIGLVAIKSLLRFDIPIGIIISDDGSLTAEDRTVIEHHVPGSILLDRFQLHKMAYSFESQPTLARLYASDFNMIVKLLHPILLGSCRHVIAMDADTIFLERPTKIIKWAEQDSGHALYLHDAAKRNAEAPWLPAALSEAISFNGDRAEFNLDHYFVNAGLLAYPRDQCDLSVAERFLAWHELNATRFAQPNASVWLGPWTREQTAYICMLQQMETRAEGLGEEYRIGGTPWHTFHHFLREGLVRKESLGKIREVISSLMTCGR